MPPERRTWGRRRPHRHLPSDVRNVLRTSCRAFELRPPPPPLPDNCTTAAPVVRSPMPRPLSCTEEDLQKSRRRQSRFRTRSPKGTWERAPVAGAYRCRLPGALCYHVHRPPLPTNRRVSVSDRRHAPPPHGPTDRPSDCPWPAPTDRDSVIF